MSLDVYLRLPGPAEPGPPVGRIFVRRDGARVEISRAEWDRLNPGREPVVVVSPRDPREVYSANITGNLAPMAGEVGLYEPLWQPEEDGISHAHQVLERSEPGSRASRQSASGCRRSTPPTAGATTSCCCASPATTSAPANAGPTPKCASGDEQTRDRHRQRGAGAQLRPQGGAMTVPSARRYPDPASLSPEQRRGVRLHRHRPDRLSSWVFPQHQVWVDVWGHEHEIESMARDYVRNVIAYCQRRAEVIRDICAADGAVLGVGAESAREAREWLEATPLMRALRRRLT